MKVPRLNELKVLNHTEDGRQREHHVPSSEDLRSLRRAALSNSRVKGATHTFYRYPARFAPELAREAIQTFTKPGDVVLDPFMGGGTSAVEALILRRRFVGVDVNPIAKFLTKVKTSILSDTDVSTLLDWAESSYRKSLREDHVASAEESSSRIRNVPWWLKRQIAILLSCAAGLPNKRLEEFARCSILRTSQWALDNRKGLVSTEEFRVAHWEQLQAMLEASFDFREEVQAFSSASRDCGRRLLCRSSIGLEHDSRVPPSWKPIRLVLTSPPYPGVHVLYHRWQVMGRRETSAPYWIIGREDGHPASYFTMGPRYALDMSRYLVNLESSFRSVAAMLDRRSLVIQLIGFSDPGVQLGPVIDALESAGLEEVQDRNSFSGLRRIWRMVPNRKWHARLSGLGADQEVLLVHRLAS